MKETSVSTTCVKEDLQLDLITRGQMDVLSPSQMFRKVPKRLTKGLYSLVVKSKATVREGETKTSFLPRPLAPEVLLGCSCGTRVRVMYSSSHQPRDFLL